MIRFLFVVIAIFSLNACSRMMPNSPEEQAAEDARMRQMLNDSSPRELNDHPKVMDEFKATFPTCR